MAASCLACGDGGACDPVVPSACTEAGGASSGTAASVQREDRGSCRLAAERLPGLAGVVVVAVEVGRKWESLVVGRPDSGVRLGVVTKLVVVGRPRS